MLSVSLFDRFEVPLKHGCHRPFVREGRVVDEVCPESRCFSMQLCCWSEGPTAATVAILCQ